MRIGIYDPYLDTLSGGEKYMLSIAKCLTANNEVFVFWDGKEKDLRERSLLKLGLDLSSVKFSPNLFSKKVSLLNRLLTSRQYDKIIYLSDGSIPLVLSKLYVHFQFPIEFVRVNFKLKYKLNRVSKFFCNSNFTKKYIDKKLEIDSLVLYPPVFIKQTSDVEKSNLILHIGRFDMSNGTNYKKQDVMIDVFKAMVDKGLKNWKFMLIIGVNEGDEEKVKALYSLSGGYPIEIVINPKNSYLWEQYAKAKIYWHATGFGENLDKNPERAEHFGISTVEAMGMGAVPVVINVGGQPEIVEDGINGFLWKTTDDLMKKTNRLIKEPELWKKLSLAGMERSKVFIGDRFCNDVKEIIDK